MRHLLKVLATIGMLWSAGVYAQGIYGTNGAGGGGGGSPGGSNTQLQYNNSSAFGGISGATSNGTAVTFTASDLIMAGGSGSQCVQGSGGVLALQAFSCGPAGEVFNITSSQNPTASDWLANAFYQVNASSLTITLPHSTTLSNNSAVTISARTNSVTLALANAGDAINGGSAGSSVTISSGALVVVSTDGAGNFYTLVTGGGGGGLTVGTTTIGSGTSGRVEYNNGGTLGEYSITGTAGSVVMSAGAPAFSGTPSVTGTATSSVAALGVLGVEGSVGGTYPLLLVQPTSATATTNWSGNTSIGVNCVNGQIAMDVFKGDGGNDTSEWDCNGNVRALSMQISGGQIFFWGGRSVISSPADGNLLIQNDAQTSFGLLQFGNNTSSFPALKRNAAALEFRLADDSGSTSFVATTGILNAIASDATHTDATVCADSSSGQLYKGSGTLGICLGTSSARYKHDIASLQAGLSEIMKLDPVSFRYNTGYGDPGKEMYGFTAEEMARVLPKLVGDDATGKPNTADYVGLIPVMVKALQEQQKEIAALKRALSKR